jgi:hypothetical protein
MPASADKPIYQALVIPNEALAEGGTEILRAGLIKNELYVTARRAFDDPAMWGEALGEIARRIARICAQEGKLTHRDAFAAIAGAFAAELGAPVVREKAGKRAAPRAKKAAKRAARKSATKKSAKKSTKRKVR